MINFLRMLATTGQGLFVLALIAIAVPILAFLWLVPTRPTTGFWGNTRNTPDTYAAAGKIGQLDLSWASQRVAQNPNDVKALRALAQANFYNGKFNEAIANLTDAIKLAPEDASLWRQRADYEDTNADAAGAKRDRDYAAKLDEHKWRSFFHMGD